MKQKKLISGLLLAIVGLTFLFFGINDYLKHLEMPNSAGLGSFAYFGSSIIYFSISVIFFLISLYLFKRKKAKKDPS